MSGREDDVVVGAFALAEDDVFDSGLDDLSGAERAGFGFVDGRIFGGLRRRDTGRRPGFGYGSS